VRGVLDDKLQELYLLNLSSVDSQLSGIERCGGKKVSVPCASGCWGALNGGRPAVFRFDSETEVIEAEGTVSLDKKLPDPLRSNSVATVAAFRC
jgi:hypothetical protein